MAEEQAKIKLHWLNGSRANSILFLLEELQVPYDVEVYHRLPSMLAPPEMEKVHPLGKSPVVTITAPGAAAPVVLAESGFIFEYLCEHFAQHRNLVPRRWKEGQEGKVLGETEAWMRYQYLMYYIEGSFMPNMVQFFILSALKSKQVPFLIRPISGAIADRMISMVIFPNIKKHLKFLEGQLETSGGDFLTGAELTAADIQFSYALVASRDSFDKMGKWDKGTARATCPKLFAYIDRLEQLGGWKKAVEKTKEIDNGKFSLLPEPA